MSKVIFQILIIIVPFVITLFFVMYSFQKLKYILTQKEATKRPDLLEEITQQLEYGISQKKIVKNMDSE